jgi:hypothetical protein
MLNGQALVPMQNSSAFGAELARELSGDWGAEAGTVTLAGGSCDIHSWPEGLRVEAYAATEADLRRIEDELGEIVAQLGGGKIEWVIRPSTVPGAPPATMPVYNFPPGEDDE